jgi:hypothetical protein
LIYFARIARRHCISAQYSNAARVSLDHYKIWLKAHRDVPIIYAIASIIARVGESGNVLEREPIILYTVRIDYSIGADLKTIGGKGLYQVGAIRAADPARIIPRMFIYPVSTIKGRVSLDQSAGRLKSQARNIAVIIAIASIRADRKIACAIVSHCQPIILCAVPVDCWATANLKTIGAEGLNEVAAIDRIVQKTRIITSVRRGTHNGIDNRITFYDDEIGFKTWIVDPRIIYAIAGI